jgi:hypothetical protein
MFQLNVVHWTMVFEEKAVLQVGNNAQWVMPVKEIVTAVSDKC